MVVQIKVQKGFDFEWPEMEPDQQEKRCVWWHKTKNELGDEIQKVKHEPRWEYVDVFSQRDHFVEEFQRNLFDVIYLWKKKVF